MIIFALIIWLLSSGPAQADWGEGILVTDIPSAQHFVRDHKSERFVIVAYPHAHLSTFERMRQVFEHCESIRAQIGIDADSVTLMPQPFPLTGQTYIYRIE